MRLRWAMGVLVFLSALQTASAFYDPTPQRWINRDRISEAGGINLFLFVANQATTLFDGWGEQVGKPSSSDQKGKPSGPGGGWGGWHPPYKADATEADVKSRGNCWRYACWDKVKSGEYHGPYAPGWNAATDPSCTDPCTAMIEGINKAGGQGVGKDGKCPEGYHKISVQWSDNAYGSGRRDVHFSTENPDGTWWEKPGRGTARQTQGPPNVVDPSYRYCGTTCVPDNFDTDKVQEKPKVTK